MVLNGGLWVKRTFFLMPEVTVSLAVFLHSTEFKEHSGGVRVTWLVRNILQSLCFSCLVFAPLACVSGTPNTPPLVLRSALPGWTKPAGNGYPGRPVIPSQPGMDLPPKEALNLRGEKKTSRSV